MIHVLKSGKKISIELCFCSILVFGNHLPRVQERHNRKNCHFGALLSRSSSSILWNRVRNLRNKRSFKIDEAVNVRPFSASPAGFLLRNAVTIFISGRTLKTNQGVSIHFKILTNFNVDMTLEIHGYFLDKSSHEFTQREQIF
jgi:hypothetical protein